MQGLGGVALAKVRMLLDRCVALAGQESLLYVPVAFNTLWDSCFC